MTNSSLLKFFLKIYKYVSEKQERATYNDTRDRHGYYRTGPDSEKLT